MDSNITAETPEERFARHCRERAEHEARKEQAQREAEEQREQSAELERMAARLTVNEIRRPTACVGCGKQIQARVILLNGHEMITGRACPECVEKREREFQDERVRSRNSNLRFAWEELCPEDYRETDSAQVVRALEELQNGGQKFTLWTDGAPSRVTPEQVLKTVNEWPLTGPGLALIGETGHCKTRLMFLLLERLHFNGQRVAYVNSATLEDTVGAYFSESASAAHNYIKGLETVENLFIDDLGKGKLTDRAEEALYRIIEGRKARRKRLFFTANSSGKELEKRMSVDRGAPIVRRLREMCQAITL